MSSRSDEMDSSGALEERREAARLRRERVTRAVADFRAGREREASFRLVYESYFHPLRRFFARKGLRPDECLDLTQETFLGIYKGLETSYREQSRFEAWLYHLATNAYRKRLRAARTAKRAGHEVPVEKIVNEERALASPAGQTAEMIEEERRDAMRKAIRKLPDQMRKCLTLRLYHELTYREIAAVMRIKIDTVKAHLFQARSRLRETLRETTLETLEL